MTVRYISVGELTPNDLGKMVSVGSAETGIVTGILCYLDADTEYVEEKSYDSAETTKIPVRVIYGLGVGDWLSSCIGAETRVTITD